MATRRTQEAGRAPIDMVRVNALTQAATSAFDAGDLQGAISNFEQLLQLDPGNGVILSNLGVLYFNIGNKERAIAMFADAHALAPHDVNIRNNYIRALGGAATERMDRMAQDGFPQAVEWLRRGLALEPGHAGCRVSLSNALELSGQPALLSDFMPDTAPEALGTHLLIACMPKSGSTFLKETLGTLTGWMEANFAYAYLQNEQEIYLPNLIQVAEQNTVTQQHCRATGPNTQILQAFGIRPIVLVRKLSDIVLSLSDFYDKGATTNTFFGDVWPELDAAAKYDLIIDHVMPWYAAFYASWERVQRLGSLSCLMVSYEEMLADKPAMIQRIADFLELGKTAEDCAAAVRAIDGDAAKTRFNKGVAGRGDATLTADQKARLRRLVTTYGDLDLKRVGLAE